MDRPNLGSLTGWGAGQVRPLPLSLTRPWWQGEPGIDYRRRTHTLGQVRVPSTHLGWEKIPGSHSSSTSKSQGQSSGLHDCSPGRLEVRPGLLGSLPWKLEKQKREVRGREAYLDETTTPPAQGPLLLPGTFQKGFRFLLRLNRPKGQA